MLPSTSQFQNFKTDSFVHSSGDISYIVWNFLYLWGKCAQYWIQSICKYRQFGHRDQHCIVTVCFMPYLVWRLLTIIRQCWILYSCWYNNEWLLKILLTFIFFALSFWVKRYNSLEWVENKSVCVYVSIYL